MGTLRLSLNPGLKVDCTAVGGGRGEEGSRDSLLLAVPLATAIYRRAPGGQALLPATLLPGLPMGELGSGPRQHLHTAWEKPKCHFHLIINMCQRGLDPSDLGLWGHWTVKSF